MYNSLFPTKLRKCRAMIVQGIDGTKTFNSNTKLISYFIKKNSNT